MSDLSDLMNKDPLSLTKDDLTQIVEYHRKTRENYVAGVKAPKAKAASGPKPDLKQLAIEI